MTHPMQRMSKPYTTGINYSVTSQGPLAKSPLIHAMQTDDELTDNGMPTSSTSGTDVLDLFSNIGAMRGKDYSDVTSAFHIAYLENALLAMKIAFWARDCRGGAGERQSFRYILQWLARNAVEALKKNLYLIPVFGRWDDLFCLLGINSELDALIAEFVRDALNHHEERLLVGKWLPREASKTYPGVARTFASAWGIKPKQYRKLIVANSRTVEQQLSSGQVDSIRFESVPAYAMKKYRKAFSKRCGDTFKAYLEAVKKGEKKINAGTLFPYDICRAACLNSPSATELQALDLQWQALPNYLGNEERKMLVVCDTSGSMTGGFGATLRPIDVSVSLALYLAERNCGPFKDHCISFSEKPTLHHIVGADIREKMLNLCATNWIANTNIEAVFKLVLTTAINQGLLQSDMPNAILIISDMEFDECATNRSESVMTMIKRMFSYAGYECPQLIFWKVCDHKGKNSPVKFNQIGAALVSGASPAIMKSILSGGWSTPYDLMLATVNSERYAAVTV